MLNELNPGDEDAWLLVAVLAAAVKIAAALLTE